jgi:hypothetical protein
MGLEDALSLVLLLMVLSPVSSVAYGGAANPTKDVAKLTATLKLTQQTATYLVATANWLNNDIESHTASPARDKPAAYTYLAILQQPHVNTPKYPVDAQGRQITSLPVYTYTNDGKIEVGLSWDPQIILTGKDISFFVSFFDLANNRPHLLPYNFIMVQNGKQLENIPSLTQLGINVFHFVFANAGPLFIQVENVGGSKAYAEFNTTVYNNANLSSAAINTAAAPYLHPSSNSFNINPVYVTYGIIFAIPVAAVTIVVLYKKGIMN